MDGLNRNSNLQDSPHGRRSAPLRQHHTRSDTSRAARVTRDTESGSSTTLPPNQTHHVLSQTPNYYRLLNQPLSQQQFLPAGQMTQPGQTLPDGSRVQPGGAPSSWLYWVTPGQLSSESGPQSRVTTAVLGPQLPSAQTAPYLVHPRVWRSQVYVTPLQNVRPLPPVMIPVMLYTGHRHSQSRAGCAVAAPGALMMHEQQISGPFSVLPPSVPLVVPLPPVPAYQQQLESRRHSSQLHSAQPQQQPRVVVNKKADTSFSTHATVSKSSSSSNYPIADRDLHQARLYLPVKVLSSTNSYLSSAESYPAQRPVEGPAEIVATPSWRPWLPNARHRTMQPPAVQQPGLSRQAFLQPSAGAAEEPCRYNPRFSRHQGVLPGGHTDGSPAPIGTCLPVSLDTLPSLALLKVLSFLPLPDLVLRVRLTCHSLNQASYDPSLWTSVSISQLSVHTRKQNLTAQLLKQPCYIAGRQPLSPWDTEGEGREEGGEVVRNSNPAAKSRNQTGGGAVSAAESQHESDVSADLNQRHGNEEHGNKTNEEDAVVLPQSHSIGESHNIGRASSTKSESNSETGAPVWPCDKKGTFRNEQDKMGLPYPQMSPQRKQVKDYIRALTVSDELQAIVSYVYTIRNRRKLCLEVENSCIFSSDVPVCSRLRVLNISCANFSPSLVPMVAKHPWLTELSVTLTRKHSKHFLQTKEGNLVKSYQAFRSLTHLKKFQFVFPNSTSFKNDLVGNVLYFYTGAFYGAMKMFFKAATLLEDIVVTDVSDSVAITILDNCRRLKSLAFSSHVLSYRSFPSQPPCPTLTSLVISSTLSTFDALLGNAIATVFPNLKAVNITDMPPTEDGHRILLKRCRSLEAVHLYDHPGVPLPRNTKPFFYSKSNLTCLLTPGTGSAGLRELSVSTDVDDHFVRTLCRCHPLLASFSLTGSPDITDGALAAMAALCPRLSHFRLCQDHSHVSARGVLGLLHSCVYLTSLEVTSTTNKGRFVPASERYLERMREAYRKPTQDQSRSESLVGSSDEVEPETDLTGHQTRNPATRRAYPGKDFRTLPQKGVEKKTMDSASPTPAGVTPGAGVTPRAGVTLGAGHGATGGELHTENAAPLCGPSQTLELCLGRVPQMTSEDVQVLVRACSDLVELHLSGCLSLDDSAVELILRGCPRLRSLTLDRQARGVTVRTCRLTDRTLGLIADHGVHLDHLRLFHCYTFTSQAIAALLVTSSSLKVVTLTLGVLHAVSSFAAVDRHVQALLERRRSSPVACSLRLDVRERVFQERWRSNRVKISVVKRFPPMTQGPSR